MTSKAKTPKFEEAIHQLEEITRQLERGTLSLDDSVQAYERGLQLSDFCHKMLKKAERKLASIERSEKGEIEHRSIEAVETEETPGPSQNRLFQ